MILTKVCKILKSKTQKQILFQWCNQSFLRLWHCISSLLWRITNSACLWSHRSIKLSLIFSGIILVDICDPSIGATFEAQRLKMLLEWFQTKAWNSDLLPVVKIIYSDISKKRQIQSINLASISSHCSVKDWQRKGCINRWLEFSDATVDRVNEPAAEKKECELVSEAKGNVRITLSRIRHPCELPVDACALPWCKDLPNLTHYSRTQSCQSIFLIAAP